MQSDLLAYQCSLCGKNYSIEELTYTCPDDSGNLNVILDYANINKRFQPKRIFSSSEHSIWYIH
jgi:hypothetical protein